jgi:S1-C subfamily serine protease
VATCRCGAGLPPEEAGPVHDVAAGEPQGTSPTLIVALVAVLALAGAAYWMIARPAPAATPADLAATDAPGDDAAAAATSAADASPERRAWDAAAALDPAPAASASEPAAADLSAPAAAGLTPALEDMVDRAMPAIVLVETTSGRGSAFYVQHDTLITNVHVVENDGYVTLRRMDGSSISARVHSRAPAFDIAVLKVASPSPTQAYLQMGSAQSLKPGQEVIVIGSALGTLQNSVSRGIVSGLRSSGGVTLVQTDAAANPGNSGGPMLDRSGRVVGITTAGYRESQGLNFAVSIDHAKDILEGRQVAMGTEQRGLSDIKPMVPGGQRSESDRRQQLGEQEFTGRVSSAAAAADQLDEVWRRFRQGCYKSAIPGHYDREWFAVFTPQGVPGDAAAGCVDYYQSMTAEMQKFRDYMRQSMDVARRANVLPGTVRDTLRSKRLQFDGWDR